jgi:hypothetical protein
MLEYSLRQPITTFGTHFLVEEPKSTNKYFLKQKNVLFLFSLCLFQRFNRLREIDGIDARGHQAGQHIFGRGRLRRRRRRGASAAWRAMAGAEPTDATDRLKRIPNQRRRLLLCVGAHPAAHVHSRARGGGRLCTLSSAGGGGGLTQPRRAPTRPRFIL